MRAFLASAIGVACTAALVLPTAASAAIAAPTASGVSGASAASTSTAPPGSTQSLPLGPLAPGSDRAPGGAAAQGLAQREARPFSLVGVVWDDPGTELHGSVRVRTRSRDTAAWSGWQDIETHNHQHAPDTGTAERDAATVRGSTAPLWVGASDGVEVRVLPEATPRAAAGPRPLPAGLRLELVDPGDEPPPGGAEAPDEEPRGNGGGVMTAEDAATSAVNADLVPLGATEIPALTREETEAETDFLGAKPYIGPRPGIVTRRGWGADERLRERNFVYTKRVKAAFVHHSATGNNYTCSQAPSVLRSIYRYHVKSSGWRDFGYNFAIDKCGRIYEGRAGGVAKPVMGAHTLGFNSNSTGIAVLGTFSSTSPPAAAVTAVAKLTAWKLGLHGANPSAKTVLTSGGGGRYGKGANVTLNVISGHRDGFATECPGARLYNQLGTTRDTAARLQGR
ncbi:peptidoglycan recognition protein family protein [Streptomyces hypolithicus]